MVLGGRRAAAPGAVWLVGAGPGDPELLTLKALKAWTADVVVHDGLVPTKFSTSRRRRRGGSRWPSASRGTPTARTRSTGCWWRSRGGLTVVRLKGGDPFIFGRGGEEIEACRGAGSTAMSCPA